ncbi:MAG: hypothetical protein EXS37_21635 [Opitutus sp.]|nr:hypothetical protein [Opitutus sp.]
MHGTESVAGAGGQPARSDGGPEVSVPIFRTRAFGLLLLAFALEFFLFDHFGARRHTNVYPRWNDQVQYLTESYTAFEYAKAHRFGAGLWQSLTNLSAQGTLHDFVALIAFKLSGPSRSAALALNMLALIAWQAALFAAVAKAGGRPALAFGAALLPLTLSGPWQNIPGSAYDFRLDHPAMCALGVVAAVAWLSDGFRSRRAAVFFGVAVGLTLLTRFLTGTYFVGIFLGFLAWILACADRRLRTANLALAALVAFLIAAPIFWLNRDAVREYYWIGHYIGPESAIRNPHMGFGQSLAFVWGNLFQRHVGFFFLGLVAAGGVALAFSRRGEPARNKASGWVIGALFLLSPALVLTLHQQKSEVAVGALVPGFVTLAAALWVFAARRAGDGAIRTTVTVVTVSVLAFFIRSQVPPAYSPAALAETRLVNTLADEIFTRARAGKIKEPRVAVDYITDCLDAQVLRVICYERHRVLLDFNMTLPTGIAEPADETVMSRLAGSDFIFITDDAPAGGFPYDRKLAAMRPQLRAWCDAHLRAVNKFTLFGRRMILYQRHEIPFP